MRTRFGSTLALFLVAALPAFGQRPNEAIRARGSTNTGAPRQGHVPAPPPQRESHAQREPEHRPNRKINASQSEQQPLVRTRPAERQAFGPDHHRFWLPGGYYFEVAPWDWAVSADWCRDCGEDFVVYEDPDHPGWYKLYNVHTGHYVHVTYLRLGLFATTPSRGILLVPKPRRRKAR